MNNEIPVSQYMKRLLRICFLTISIFALKSCYYDVEEEILPQPDCETTEVSYSLVVSPIILTNCFFCHSEANKAIGANISLEGYQNLKIKADDGTLICAIKRLACAASPMPLGAEKLESCFINQIVAWVDEGTQNN